MKLLPIQLPPVSTTMDRLPLQLPFSPTDILWRYPLSFPAPSQMPPSSPLIDFKTHLPAALATDPRLWSRDDVNTFLKWSEREFDLQSFDMDMFQMNGKAMCLLTKNDLAERCPGAGDVLHNVLQMLVRDAQLLQRCLPSSPVTPTSRYPMSPHGHPPTPNPWSLLPHDNPFHSTAHLAHFMNQGNSVTLSPAPSLDSQQGSPQHVDVSVAQHAHTVFGNSSGSNQSDSDEDYQEQKGGVATGSNSSPPNTPGLPPSVLALQPPPCSPKEHKKYSSGAFLPTHREFFPDNTPEPNTNGRLLWDFLQQLLNDPTQRYTNYIAWKNRETGVFKIVDPAGLAKLWGIQKNHLSMNYDKMSRALRYYYRVNILRKVQGERHCYQFLRNPTELKNIKNISLLRQQMSPTRPAMKNEQQSNQQYQHNSLQQQQQQQQQHQQQAQQQQSTAIAIAMKSEIDIEEDWPIEEDMPTDLSMVKSEARAPEHNMSNVDKHRISVLVGESYNGSNHESESK